MTRRFLFLVILFIIQTGYESMWKGYHFSIKGIRKRYLFCRNGIQRGKGLDFGAEPPRIKLCRVLPPTYIGDSIAFRWENRESWRTTSTWHTLITLSFSPQTRKTTCGSCLRPCLHYAEGIWKRSFISPVRPFVQTNPSRKRSFSRALFAPKEFENDGFALKCRRKIF